MKLKLLSLLTALSLIMPAFAAVTANKGAVKGGYNFWLSTPKENPEDSIAKPLIIFLHGASLCGNDLNRVRRYGTIDAIDKGRDIDAYVIAPQNPGGAWKPAKVMDLVDWAESKYKIDTTRVYVIGMSLGGYGTLDVAATYPDRIAAAIALCGGATVSNLNDLNDVPLWIVHGTADRAVTVGQSDRVVEAMRAADKDTPRLIYDRIPGMNHGQPARIFYMPDTYEWLFKHSTMDNDRSVAAGFPINQAALRSAYNGLNHTRSYKATAHSSKKSKAKSHTTRRKRRK